MTTLLVVLGSLAVYLLIGGLIARASLPHLWKRALSYWNTEGYARGPVVAGAIFRCLLWPLMGLYELLAREIDRTNPREQERRLKEQERRIRELEQELDIR